MGGIHCIFRVFPEHFYRVRGPSLVELTGDDNNATLAVTAQIHMSPKEDIYGHHIKQSIDQPGKVANSVRGQLNRKKI